MADNDRGQRLGRLELEPKPDAAPKPGSKSVFHPNTRSKGSERRKKDERRTDVRVAETRRAKARRPSTPWDDTKPR
jgi:hypothetical protein